MPLCTSLLHHHHFKNISFPIVFSYRVFGTLSDVIVFFSFLPILDILYLIKFFDQAFLTEALIYGVSNSCLSKVFSFSLHF